MSISPDGVTADTLHALNLVLSLNPSFAARTFSGDVKQMTEIIRAGIRHPGFAFIEILQNCPTFNKATPHEWYQEHIYDTITIPNYDNTNLAWAKEVASDMDNKIATGIIYQQKNSIDFYSRQKNRVNITTELTEEVKHHPVEKLLASLK